MWVSGAISIGRLYPCVCSALMPGALIRACGENRIVPLYLTEAEVAELLTPADAVEAIEACFRRMAAGSVENRPRYRLGLESGSLAVMAAADLELGYAGAKVYAGFGDGARFVVLLFRADTPELVAVIDADKLGQLRTGAASGVAARHLAKGGACSLGLIGCGWQAESQLAAMRVALPEVERVVAYCRTEEHLRAFCEEQDVEPGDSHRDPAECDVVVTVTNSPDPVLRGEWLRAGALVCAVGANDGRRRELDNVVLERAAFVCCDSLDDAKLESADLIEPVESGVLDWLEVHELQEVVAGEVAGRQSQEDIVVFKSNGLAAWDVAVAAVAVERARAAGVGIEVS
jgi:ornithine cyclodeaminase/alanine dehydrogenase-like protein (mu-crystallin family)